MKILYRYLSREVLVATVMITGILVFIFLCQQLIRYLNYITDGTLTINALFQSLGLQLPLLVSLLAPLGFFLGIMLAYGRLYNDSEMVVMFANGLSKLQLLTYTIWLSVALAMVTAILTLVVNPNLTREQTILIQQSKASMGINKVFPGRFQVLPNSNRVYYVKTTSNDHKQLQQVFFAQPLPYQNKQHGPNRPWMVLFADTGHQTLKNKENFLVTKNGYRYQGQPGEHAYSVAKYQEYGIRIPSSQKNDGQSASMLSTAALWHKAWHQPSEAAELQWRLSIPLAVLLLGLLAIPMSHINPRSGRFSQLLPAILVAILYVNALFIARGWIQDGTISILIGMWWVHLLILVLATILIARWLGWFHLRRKTKKC